MSRNDSKAYWNSILKQHGLGVDRGARLPKAPAKARKQVRACRLGQKR
jgi:hypothetical protein